MSKSRSSHRPLTFSLVWEIPLAILSFCFFKIVKAVIGLFYGIYVKRDRKRATQWQVLSSDVLSIPIVLPVLMTKGPRWNTHAIIGTVGPFAVTKNIAIDLAPAHQSAQSWTVVVYRYPDYATVAQINSLEQGQQQQHILAVESGQYSLGVRYYECPGAVEFPAIAVDVSALPASEQQRSAEIDKTVEALTMPADTNDFYADLCDRHNGFYAALHYYIYTVLQLRAWLPESFVTREYLPVGNPDTTFLYDYVEAHQSLKVQVKSEALQDYDTYLTLYRRSSLPLFYLKLTETTTTVPAFKSKGYYLIRIRPRNPHLPAPNVDPDWIQIEFS